MARLSGLEGLGFRAEVFVRMGHLAPELSW